MFLDKVVGWLVCDFDPPISENAIPPATITITTATIAYVTPLLLTLFGVLGWAGCGEGVYGGGWAWLPLC